MVRRSLSRQYREVHLASSSPEETILMLYDGAIRFLKEAVDEIGQQNITAKVRLLDKAGKIIEYRLSCLDMEKGGEIAKNLQDLYSYMLVRLTEANFYNDVAKVEEIAKLLGTVREGWANICGAARKSEAAKTLGPESGLDAPKNITVRV